MRKLLTLLLLYHSTEAIDITAFGAVGDGKADNYYPFKMAAAYASAHPGTTITLPAGIFYIAKYRQTKNDTIDHIKWMECEGLKLIGSKGTIISMNGSFTRYCNYVTVESCAKKGYVTGLNPFYFYHCRNLEVRNMEINGNVQNTKRPAGRDDNNPSVTEGSATMLNFEMCTNVIVDNMYLHHAESDGITVSGDLVDNVWINSANLRVTNTRSHHNARQGMSIGGLDNSYFYNCEFSYTGFTGGTYGRNDPSAGIDIEPGEFHNVYNVTFDSCRFEGNYGSAFVCSFPNTTAWITLNKCRIVCDSVGKNQGITMLARHSTVDSSYLSLRGRDFKLTNNSRPGSTIAITFSTIESSDTWINTNSPNMADSVLIASNDITFTAAVMPAAFVILKTSNLQFLNNRVSASAEAIASKKSGSHLFVQNAVISSGNSFAAGIRVDYTGTKTVADP